jgi:hypothetical protein
MAVGVANYLANVWLNTIRGGAAGTSYTAPSAVYVQLHVGAPGSAGTSNISSVTTRPAATFSAASGGVLSLSNVPAWASWAGSAETIVNVSFWDAATSGNFLWSASLGTSVAMVTGATLQLTNAGLTLTIAS